MKKNKIIYETVSLGVSLPKVFMVDDYHEVGWLEDYLSVMFKDVKVKELDSDEYNHRPYLMLVYLGTKPNHQEIQALVDKI